MAFYSMAEARDRISAIFDKALTGEVVTITRDGLPVLELRTTETSESREAYGRQENRVPPCSRKPAGDSAAPKRH